jgi:uncharacterized protein GlcG (DUF336 family)
VSLLHQTWHHEKRNCGNGAGWSQIGKLSQPGGPRYRIEHSNEGLITFPGGLPIVNGDGVLIGVSGSAVENDLSWRRPV